MCGNGFEQVQAPTEPELTECPTCGLAVKRKIVHEVQVPKILKKVGPVAAKNAGFKVLKRTSHGEYERLD